MSDPHTISRTANQSTGNSSGGLAALRSLFGIGRSGSSIGTLLGNIKTHGVGNTLSGMLTNTSAAAAPALGTGSTLAMFSPWLMAAPFAVKSLMQPNFDEQVISMYNARAGEISPHYGKPGHIPRAETIVGLNQKYSPNGIPAQHSGEDYQIFAPQGGERPFILINPDSPVRQYFGGDANNRIGVGLNEYSRAKNAENWKRQAKAEEERGGK